MAVLTRTHTRTYNTINFADPYKKCLKCGNWVDGVLDAPGPIIVIPCEHQSDYRDVCSSWGPVDGCTCADWNASHPDDQIHHDMRPRPVVDDGKVY